MNLSAFIARKWATASPFRHSRRIVGMGVASIGLCVCVMVVALCILVGFKNEISHKVFGFGSHVVIQPYLNEDGESLSVYWDSALRTTVFSTPGVVSAQAYAMKGALIRGTEESVGVFFKGLPTDYDTVFFARNLKRGKLPVFSDETDTRQPVLISEILAHKLKLDTGSRLRAYFVCEGELRPRAFTVCGIYATGLEKFDETCVLCDIRQIQKLNDWEPTQADGIDIRISDPDKRHQTAERLDPALPYRYVCFPCDRLFPEIFDWLNLIDANVWVLMIIMLIVCLICLISLLFILIIERSPHIGVLKSLGGSNRLVRRIFVQQTLIILGRGLLLGNAVALELCALQRFTGRIRLNEAVYYIDTVPVAFPWLYIILINVMIIACAYLLLWSISRILNRMSPARIEARR